MLRPGGQPVVAEVAGAVGIRGLLARRRRVADRRPGVLDAIPGLLTAAGLVEPGETGRCRPGWGQVHLFRAHACLSVTRRRAAPCRARR